MKLWKTLLGTAFLLCLLTTLSASPVFGAEIVDTGPCGDDLTYTLDSDGLLTISGTGPMWDYERSTVNYYLYSTAPWGKSSITSLQIDPGVSAIGQYAFFGPADIDRYATKSTLSSVSLPEGLLSIGDFAFGYCDKLTS
ncbi:MAG: hypothetical protein IIV61_09365, partial [Oscillospiraceae bacterium]|nr:hypothetical protein [Oscillospiraceae bacterium]